MSRKMLINRVREAYASNHIPWTEEVQHYAEKLPIVQLSDLCLHWEGRACGRKQDAALRKAADMPPEPGDEDYEDLIGEDDTRPHGKPLFGGPNPNVARMEHQHRDDS